MSKPKDIDSYIKGFPRDVAAILQEMRQTIREVVPEAVEVISYSIPAFKYRGSFLIYFAGWKKHASLYPFTAEMEAAFPETAKYKTSGKGTIRFPLDEPLPLALIRKIVKFKVNAIEEKNSV